MGKGRKIEHLLPSLFNYNRLPSASSESRPRPLPAGDYETAESERIKRDHHEIEACLKRNEELEKEVRKLKSDLIMLQSQLASLSKLLPPKVDDKGQEESKEIKELKSRLTTLELEIHLDPLMKKQEEDIRGLQESSAATEKKITELMTKVADLQKLHLDQTAKKPKDTSRLSTMEKKMAELAGQVAELKRSLNSASASASSPNVLQKQKPESPVNEFIMCLFILMFLIVVLVVISS